MVPFTLSPQLFYDPIFLAAFTFLAASLLFVTRSRWLPLFALANPFRHRYAPLSDLEQGFGSDMRAGLSSRTFDLSQNLNGDSRAGLDTAAKEEIHKMMEQRGISFDEARKVFFHKKLLENGIGPDGIPNDPKALVFR